MKTRTEQPMDSARILLLTGNNGDGARLAHEMQQWIPGAHITHVASEAGLSSSLENVGCDVVVAGYRLGWTETTDAVARVRACWPDCPAIVLVADGELTPAVQTGLDNYIPGLPLDYARLAGSVHRLVALRQRMQVLRNAETRYRSLFEGVPVGLYRATPDGELIDANPALVHALGCPDRNALLGKSLAPLFVDSSVYAQWHEGLLQSGAVLGFEAMLRRHDGRIICMLGNARAVRDDDGALLYYDGSLEDITDRKRAEEELTLLQTIMVAISEAADPQASITVALKKVCDSTGWIVG